jgi:hypothetical protein
LFLYCILIALHDEQLLNLCTCYIQVARRDENPCNLSFLYNIHIAFCDRRPFNLCFCSVWWTIP